MKQRGNRYCSTCSTKLQKRGKTNVGKQRWLCPDCSRSSLKSRPDLSRAFVFEQFLKWLLGKHSQADIQTSNRTFRRKISWCWQVPVPQVLTGEIRSVIILDGIRVGGQVCLIAKTKTSVLAWVWADKENSHNWQQLMRLLPPPAYVVCDGQRGILGAISICWPRAKVQRCHFHVQANIRTKLTRNPQTNPAQDLARLMGYAHYVYTARQRNKWMASFNKLQTKHAIHLAEKTKAQDPKPGQRKWWYTHGRDRSAYRQIKNLLADGSLFCYVADANTIPRTTNHLEGGTNSLIRRQLGYHRGLPKAHQRVLANWLLYYQTEEPKPPRFGL